MTTQIKSAKTGIITEEMKLVAEAEHVDSELIRDEVAAGRVVIPANKKHLKSNLKPIGIGRKLSIKVNANIGASSASSSLQKEVEKLNAAIEAGADTVMDLSTGENLDLIRIKLLEICSLPFGTVPVYQVIEGRSVEEIDHKLIIETVRKQAEQGVDFFTIHAGILKEHLPLTKKRVGGIVSRGGALLAKWMLHHNRQNPFYELFDELCNIFSEYDVCFSLGDGLRPGAIADATDEAQLAELETLGELTERAQQNGCQVMVEGPGHVPFEQIEHNMRIQRQICNDAPFYVLGPLVTDIAAGYDHITSAIGGTAAGFHGASFLCYVTPAEHLGLPGADDVRRGVIASRIAAHAADIAKGSQIAAARDRKLSIARANLDWKTHLNNALDPQTAKNLHKQACKLIPSDASDPSDYCSMCGREWCSLRINKQIKRQI